MRAQIGKVPEVLSIRENARDIELAIYSGMSWVVYFRGSDGKNEVGIIAKNYTG